MDEVSGGEAARGSRKSSVYVEFYFANHTRNSAKYSKKTIQLKAGYHGNDYEFRR